MSKFVRGVLYFLEGVSTQQVAPVRICLCSPILFIWLKWLVCLFFVFNGQITLLYVSANVFLCSGLFKMQRIWAWRYSEACNFVTPGIEKCGDCRRYVQAVTLWLNT